MLVGIGQLHAEDAPFTYHLGMHFGKNYADSSSKMRDNALYGIRTTVMLTPFYGLSIGYDRMESIDIKESSETIDAQRYYAQIEVDGEEQYHTVPYITFGAGYEDLSRDVYVTDGEEKKKYDVSQFYLTAGLGFRYNFIPELSLYAEGNVLYKTDTTDVDYTMLAGLLYHINATTCDNTYVTERMHDKPQEHTVLHTGAINALSGWKKLPTTSVQPKKEYRHKVRQKPIRKKPVAKKSSSKKRHVMQKRRVVSHKKSKSFHSGGYYVILGAYKTKKGLESQIRKLTRAHVPYLLRDSQHKKMTYVMSGAYPTHAKAEAALKRLKALQKDAYIAKMK